MLRHITWEIFFKDYIELAIPAKYKLPGSPSVVFYVSDKAERIGIKVYIDKNIQLPEIPLRELTLVLKTDNDGYYADFSTTNRTLFEHFYSMMCFISDSVQIKNNDIIDAINEAVESLKILVSNKQLLSEEKILGIWGELWVLERLIKERGSKSVYFWKGADKAIHDFRISGVELEVKTTRNEDRIHIISRLTQLVASPEQELYLCSIQLVEGATEGLTLGQYVETISELLRDDREAKIYFEKQLEKEGYKFNQTGFYTSHYYLRSNPELIPVTEKIPKITRSMIDEKFAEELSSRINNVHYSLDVTGLGFEFTDSELKKLLVKEK